MNSLRRISIALLPLFATPLVCAQSGKNPAASDPVEFTADADSTWQERSFVGNTAYTINGEGDSVSIRGRTDGTASVLYRRQKMDLTQHPVVSWRWKISNTFGDLQEQTKAGDDYPARFYVVLKTGLLPWQTLTVNYVWSSSGRMGDTWNNAFTSKAKMLALQAGSNRVGEWVTEKRNVVEDFKRLFDIDVTQLHGYAFMIDGDNSGSAGTAWFEGLVFSAN